MEMTVASIDAWRTLVREVSRASALDGDDAFKRLLAHVAQLLDAQDAYGVVARRTEDANAQPLGWAPRQAFFLNEPEPALLRMSKAYLTNPKSLARSEYLQRLMTLTTHARVLLREEAIGASTWSDTESGNVMELRGMMDRIMGATPLGRGLALFLAIDRDTTQPNFGLVEKQLLTTALELLVPFGRNLALSYGLNDGAVALTRREQVVLRHLLSGARELDIADALNVSPHTIHDHTKRVFKKFGVTSRAELTSLWLASWDD